MRILLDSHALVWFVTGDNRCSARARTEIERAGSETHVSAATAWELATKVRLGKWPDAERTAREIGDMISNFDLTPLPISVEHARLAGSLPGDHRDPFDRMLAAQAALEDLVLISADRAFRQFGTRVVW